MTATYVHLLILSSILFISLITDLKKREVYHTVIIAGFAGAIIWHSFMGGWWQGLFGLLLNFSISFAFFCMGEAVGAGDVKLLSFIGFLTNPWFALISFFIIALTGLFQTLFLLFIRKNWSQTKENTRRILFALFVMKAVPAVPKGELLELPYAVPIFIGTLVTVALVTSQILKGVSF